MFKEEKDWNVAGSRERGSQGEKPEGKKKVEVPCDQDQGGTGHC